MFTLIDLAGLVIAAALFVPLLLLPGYLIGASMNPLHFRAANGGQKLMLATLFGQAVLPGPIAVITTLIGLKTGLVVVLALALCGGVALAMDGLPSLSRRALMAIGAWCAVLAFVWVDVEWGGHLYQSLTTIDMLKHASITRAIVESSATPPADPFFARSGTAVFYYFYFILPAMAEVLAVGFIDSRAAVGGMVVWTGIALFGLMLHVYRASGLRAGTTISPLMAVLALAGGLQFISVVKFGHAQSNWANDQITPWPVALIWVPHHVAGFIASWVAMLLIAAADRHDGRAGKIYGTLLAGACLASAAGMSIWVTFGTVIATTLWGLVLVRQRRWNTVLALTAAGAVSLLIAAPFLIGLISSSAAGTSPIAFAVRPFFFAESLAELLERQGLSKQSDLLNFIFLPLNYLFELGLLVAGALAYWLKRNYRRGAPNDIATLLVITTVASFLIGTFLKSAIANNDLGWRVMMFAQFAMLMWTAHVVWPFWLQARQGLRVLALPRRLPRVMGVFLVLGLVAVAYDIVMMRFFYATPFTSPGDTVRSPPVDLELRRAFGWLSNTVGRDRVVQHNPNGGRAFAFALYGRQPVAVSDMHNPFLLGASHTAVAQRLSDLIPLFNEVVPRETFVGILKKHGVHLLIITSIDPIWSQRPSWLDAVQPVFASKHVRIIPVDRLTP